MDQHSVETAPTDLGAPGVGNGMRGLLSGLQAFCLRRGNAANAARIEESTHRLVTQTFNLVVFGEFKRGKTTFINALIGDGLLPAAVVPLTSAVTLLHHAPQLRVSVEYLDGRVQEVSRGALSEYVTEKGNPANEKQVKVVRVGVPCELLRNGLQLVDTPGVGSVYDHNTETAREFLPHVDGAILLVASDPPISRGECEFLVEMRPHVARLFVVQNKTDQLRPEDLAESLEFTRGVLRQVLGSEDVQVFPLCARDALAAKLSGDHEGLDRSGMSHFEAELRRFQSEEQEEALLRSVAGNALRITEDERLGLDLERQALRMSVEEIERRYREFLRRRDAILAQREDDIVLIRETSRKLIRRTLQQDYEEERTRQGPLLTQRLSEWGDEQGDIPPGELLKRGNELIRETLFEALGAWRRSEEHRLEQRLAESLERFTVRTNEAIAAVYECAGEVFDLPPRSVETIGYLSAPSRFLWRDWDWKPPLGLSGSLGVQLLPGARQRAMQSILQKLLEEHDKGCGRLRHDFAERAQAAFEEYVRSVNRAMDETFAGIDRAIDRVVAQKQDTAEDVVQAEARILQETQELGTLVEAIRSSAFTGGDRAA